MSHGCDRVKVKTLSRKFDKWECIWCGQRQTVKKGGAPVDTCAKMDKFKQLHKTEGQGDE